MIHTPRVTSIIGFLSDYSGCPPDILEHKRQIGQAVHKSTEYYDLGILDESSLDAEVGGYVEGWKRFLEDKSCEILGLEEEVRHKRYNFIGHYDKRVLLGGKHSVLEIKTTAQMYPSFAAQLAAYKEAYNHRKPKQEKITHRYAVQLKPKSNPPYQLHEYRDPADWSVFLAGLTIYTWRMKYE